MDAVAVLQLYDRAMDDPDARSRAQVILDQVAGHLHLDPPPRPDEVGSVTVVGVTPQQLAQALNEVAPGWQGEGLLYWPA